MAQTNRTMATPKSKDAKTKQQFFTHQITLAVLIGLAFLMCYLYMTLNVSEKFPEYAFYIRQPKLWGMLITAFCIGTATVAFQSVVNNTLITPCLLGMSSFYSFTSAMVTVILSWIGLRIGNPYLSFIVNLLAVAVFGSLLYGILFKKTKYNVLYVLLAGTVLTNLFNSARSFVTTLARSGTTTIGSSSNSSNTDMLLFYTILCLVIVVIFWQDIRTLDVLCLGRNHAIGLGVNYDRQTARVLIGVLLLIALSPSSYTFLGIILANLARQIFKTYRHCFLLLGSFALGVICLVGSQILIEHYYSFNVSTDAIITIVGGSYCLFLLVKNKGRT